MSSRNRLFRFFTIIFSIISLNASINEILNHMSIKQKLFLENFCFIGQIHTLNVHHNIEKFENNSWFMYDDVSSTHNIFRNVWWSNQISILNRNSWSRTQKKTSFKLDSSLRPIKIIVGVGKLLYTLMILWWFIEI